MQGAGCARVSLQTTTTGDPHNPFITSTVAFEQRRPRLELTCQEGLDAWAVHAPGTFQRGGHVQNLVVVAVGTDDLDPYRKATRA